MDIGLASWSTYFGIAAAGSEQTDGHTGHTRQHMQGQLQVWGEAAAWNLLGIALLSHTGLDMR